MPYPLVDFVQVSDCPERPVQVPQRDGRTASASVRVLNVDPSTGGHSVVVSAAGGFTVPGGRFSCDVEVLLLEGGARIGDQQVDRYGYLFVPAGVAVDDLVVSEHGASVLLFTSGPLELVAAAGDAAGAPRHRLVGPLHVGDVAWERPRTDGFPAGAGRKTLRDDPEAGEGFWVLGVLPHWDSPMTEWHSFSEENYILEGEIETTEGVMRVGGYLAHPAGPDSVHGPMRSRSGALLITRAMGPMGNTYTPSSHYLPGDWR